MAQIMTVSTWFHIWFNFHKNLNPNYHFFIFMIRYNCVYSQTTQHVMVRFDSNRVPRNRLYMTVEWQSIIHQRFIMQSFLSSFINRSCLLDHIFIITQSIRMYKLITHCSCKRISNSIWFLISRFLIYFSIKTLNILSWLFG